MFFYRWNLEINSTDSLRILLLHACVGLLAIGGNQCSGENASTRYSYTDRLYVIVRTHKLCRVEDVLAKKKCSPLRSSLVTEIHYCPSKLCQLSIDNRRRGGCAPSTRSPPSSIYEHPISSNRIPKPTQVLRDGNEIPSVVGPVPSSLR
jgi:hypothetical protein